jgi:putative transposase
MMTGYRRNFIPGGSKHGRVSDWPYSTFHQMVRRGIYPEDRAGDNGNADSGFGER